jgi:cell division protein FtsB
MGSLLRWLTRLTAAAVIAGALAYIPYRVYGSEGYVKYRKLTREQRDMAKKNRELAAENARLTRQIHRLKTDPEAIAAVARDELGMVAPDEIVIQIDRSLTAPSSPLEPDRQ